MELFIPKEGLNIKENKSLIEIADKIASPELNEVIHEFAFLGNHYQEFHSANAGDVSQVLSPELGNELIERFKNSLSDWYPIAEINKLSDIRNDGRSHYRAEGIKNPDYYKKTLPMSGRVMIITRTGAQIPFIDYTVGRLIDGKLFNILRLNNTGDALQIVYGNDQFGSIPSIETHIHILSNAVSINDGYNNPGFVHGHPKHLVLLGDHPKIKGDIGLFNVAIMTTNEGINRNLPGVIGLAQYQISGSESLVDETLKFIDKYRLIVWRGHGAIARGQNIRTGYTLLAYADNSAEYALAMLKKEYMGLPYSAVQDFLEQHKLVEAYKSLYTG